MATSVQRNELSHSWGRRESRYENKMDRFKPWSRTQGKLRTGDIVHMDTRSSPGTGIIVETLPHNQYRVKSCDSGHRTVLNRQVLWKLGQDGSVDFPGNSDDYRDYVLNNYYDCDIDEDITTF